MLFLKVSFIEIVSKLTFTPCDIICIECESIWVMRSMIAIWAGVVERHSIFPTRIIWSNRLGIWYAYDRMCKASVVVAYLNGSCLKMAILKSAISQQQQLQQQTNSIYRNLRAHMYFYVKWVNFRNNGEMCWIAKGKRKIYAKMAQDENSLRRFGFWGACFFFIC